MNVSHSSETLAPSAAGARFPGFSRLVRRVHMFSGLFLGPWMLMYALSTLVMTHRGYVSSFYKSKRPALVKERELDYSRTFTPETTREQMAQQILQDIGLDGTHNVSGGKDGKPLVIQRQNALTPRRITYDTSGNKLLIEREAFRTPNFLERMHRRRGYNSYRLENTWGATVDIAVVAMAFWSLSGVWLWWEIKAVRFWGAVSFAAGLTLFGIFLFLI
jgi:hypothetical protein